MSDKGNIVSKEKLQKYLDLTTEARIKATPITSTAEDERRLNEMLKILLRFKPPYAQNSILISFFEINKIDIIYPVWNYFNFL